MKSSVPATKKAPRVSAAKRFAQIERISIAGITERMGPLGLHMYAESFLAAALSIPPPVVPFEPARLYLLCHAIELGLKAFLSAGGHSMLELAEGAYGHNLAAILEKAEGGNLLATASLSEEHRTAIRRASVYYAGKVFEYPAGGEALAGYPNLPPAGALAEAASTLVTSIRQLCREAK